jgi:hypothetical protein
MRPPYSTLTPTPIYDYAATLLEFHLQWQDQGPKCTVKVLLEVLLYGSLGITVGYPNILCCQCAKAS